MKNRVGKDSGDHLVQLPYKSNPSCIKTLLPNLFNKRLLDVCWTLRCFRTNVGSRHKKVTQSLRSVGEVNKFIAVSTILEVQTSATKTQWNDFKDPFMMIMKPQLSLE